MMTIDDLAYATDVRKARRKTGLKTQEFFTPRELVKRMCDKVPEDVWSDPSKRFVEPCFGNGNFLVEIIQRKIQHGSTWRQALSTTFGVELMADNVAECIERICDMLREEPYWDETEAREIMGRNLVCSDFFKWDFENWKPIEENKKK